jgi:hypothetical protein
MRHSTLLEAPAIPVYQPVAPLRGQGRRAVQGFPGLLAQ